MSSEWSTKRLGDVIEFVIDNRGRNPSSYETSGIPVIDNHLIISDGVVNLDNIKRYISEETYNTFLRKYIVSGDVLMTLVGNGYGKVALAPEQKSAIIQNTIGLRCNKEHCNSYLYYLLKINRKSFENLNRGAAQPSIKVGDILEVEFLFPPLRIQKKIAHSLRSIDKSIQLNRQTNQTLEHIAQALFKSWFVDFEPTRAKIAAKQAGQDPERAAMAAISGKTVAELEQLDAAQLAQLKTTAALFPDELVESELGEVPEGWEVKPLYETAEYINGSAFKTKDFSDNQEGLPIVKIVELKNGITQSTKFTTGQFKEKYSITSGDILYSWSGSPETSLEVFKWFGGSAWLNQHIFKLNFTSIPQKHFAYFLLKQMKPVLIATAKQKQTTGLGHITVADMKRLLVAYPNYELLTAFSDLVNPIYEKSSSLDMEIIELTNLRDTLLPKLLSNELSPTQTEVA